MENLPGRGFGGTCCVCVSFAWEIVRDSPMVNLKGVFLSVNPKTDFKSKNGFRVPFGKSKSGFLIW